MDTTNGTDIESDTVQFTPSGRNSSPHRLNKEKSTHPLMKDKTPKSIMAYEIQPKNLGRFAKCVKGTEI